MQCWGKWSKVVGSGRGVDVRALEDFGRTAEQVPGPSQVGATAPETPRSNSPTQLLPRHLPSEQVLGVSTTALEGRRAYAAGLKRSTAWSETCSWQPIAAAVSRLPTAVGPMP